MVEGLQARNRGLVGPRRDLLTERQTISAERFGQNCVREMLSQIQADIRDVHLDWAYQFIKDLFPSTEAEVELALRRAQTELPAPLDHALTFNMALDLSGATRKMKAYMFPMAKNLATGRQRDARDAGFDAIRNLKPHGNRLAPAVDFLDLYWDTCPEKLVLDMIGMDCVDPSKARIKIYAHLPTRNSWDLIRHVSTFGGQATDVDRLKGLEILHSLWDILRNEQSNHGDHYDKPMRHPTSFLGSIMFSFEIVPDRQIPDVKIYVPMWQYAPSDGHVADNLMSAFRKLGWNDVAKNYLRNLRRTFPGADFESPLSVLHSNLSYSYSPATGAYMSVYYAISGKATIKNGQSSDED
ncbi:7-dimethylallyltryptophan synthase 3 [Colletotrichum chlorophyti]|uniref:7-dimethylallyltryptophan synthase 3 n=1 Tax=Colletotrichum chlorophyti TaxID=708187 RepID=A0A1Q8S6G9_9PEZI|nr:7-dimethylallyltryptophan synthase 3 [Colletotrichum chlorophyti]